METLSVRCNHCGAPLEVGKEIGKANDYESRRNDYERRRAAMVARLDSMRRS